MQPKGIRNTEQFKAKKRTIIKGFLAAAVIVFIVAGGGLVWAAKGNMGMLIPVTVLSVTFFVLGVITSGEIAEEQLIAEWTRKKWLDDQE